MSSLISRSTPLYMKNIASPIGSCTILGTEHGVCWVSTPGADSAKGLAWAERHLGLKDAHDADKSDRNNVPSSLDLASDELSRYFSGEHVTFSCALDLHGTPFQVAVWKLLLSIPYGETCSYGKLAHVLGRPTASRAVGAANGANPIAIIVPCHRVIGSNGSLTGYGGGLAAKEWLLKLERGNASM